jgi:hypothetical protein
VILWRFSSQPGHHAGNRCRYLLDTCSLLKAAIPAAAATAAIVTRSIECLVVVCVYSGPMEDMPEGLTDKLYWRRARGEWHCFQQLCQVPGFISLCHRQEITFVHGQQIARPEARLRCELCDGLEMALRGWEGSGPASLRRVGGLSR